MTTLATAQIRMDHMHVITLFHRYKPDSSPRTKEGIVRNISAALEIHAQLEEEIFYPALRSAGIDTEVVDKSVPEHDEIRRLIGELRIMEPTDASYDDTFMALMREVIHHAADEETYLLPDAERLLADRLPEIGRAMTRRRMELVKPRAGELASSFAEAASNKSMLLAGGAALAGAYIIGRALTRNGDAGQHHS